MTFYKYHGAGNDFVLLDQRQEQWITRADTQQVAALCHRHFGIGADGLILLQNHATAGHEMIYFNSDGRESTMCGNGGRCFAAFAHHLGLVEPGGMFHFLAIDGPHEARLLRPLDTPHGEWVELQMTDVTSVEHLDNETFVLNTGSPHYVRFVSDVAQVDVFAEGRAVRYSERFGAAGINVNFASPLPDGTLRVRTYERGVEDETLACGTGVTAAAIAHFYRNRLNLGSVAVPVKAEGGDLAVRYEAQTDGSFRQIWLCGPAQRVFKGDI
jgi:diaminopimelate epimerase